jgi:hypothetical protein
MKVRTELKAGLAANVVASIARAKNYKSQSNSVGSSNIITGMVSQSNTSTSTSTATSAAVGGTQIATSS